MFYLIKLIVYIYVDTNNIKVDLKYRYGICHVTCTSITIDVDKAPRGTKFPPDVTFICVLCFNPRTGKKCICVF